MRGYQRHHPLGQFSHLRSFEAGDRLETFLVAAIAAIVGIRAFLKLTGYPALGPGGLHIAHVLWGGFLMLAALALLLIFLDRTSANRAAVIGGIGFGTFLDEMGKFVTRDNDYFFEPAVAMIYAIFVLLFLGLRALQSRNHFTPAEYRANALRQIEDARLGLDRERRARVLDFLERADPFDPLVIALRAAVGESPPAALPKEGWVARMRRRTRAWYRRLTQRPEFARVAMGFFLGLLAVRLAMLFTAIFGGASARAALLEGRVAEWVAARTAGLSFFDWAEIASALLAGVITLWGVALLRRSRLRAFRAFKRSTEVSIFLTQVFTFYREQFSALVVLAINIGIFAALQYAIEREETAPRRESKPAAEPTAEDTLGVRIGA